MLPERGGKEQQQQLSRKVSAEHSVSQEEKRALREQRISGVPGPFHSLQSLLLAFVMRSKPLACYLSVAAKNSSSSSAGKCPPDRLPVRLRKGALQEQRISAALLRSARSKAWCWPP